MRVPSYITFIVRFTSAGAIVALAFLLLALVLSGFPVWLEDVALVACPPLLMLMSTEGCGGWLSWCVAQVALVVVLCNALLYGILGYIVSIPWGLVGGARSNGAR